MVTSPVDAFAWFRGEINLIQSKRFHIFDQLKTADHCYCISEKKVTLRGSYGEFLLFFGWARLFCDFQDVPMLSVYPLQSFRRDCCENGDVFVSFAFRGQQTYWFSEMSILNNGESAVYLVNRKAGRVVHDDFSTWLKTSYDSCRAKFSDKKWKLIVSGPIPFSPRELAVVEARRHFKWRLTGFLEDGCALIAIKNNSGLTLPYFGLGVRDKSGVVLTGRAWLRVDHIAPGEEAILVKDCYKDQISPAELELFDLPEPIPEKRDAYWEFQQSGLK